MRKLLPGLVLTFIAPMVMALNTQVFEDNTDIVVTLSKSNYNRLIVKGDKITKAYFPMGYLEIQGLEQTNHQAQAEDTINGESDGSLYVITTHDEPFTLFVTTQLGHHFSLTVESEVALGKTIEFSSKGEVATVQRRAAKTIPAPQRPKPPLSDAISALMAQMIEGDRPIGFDEHRHFGRAKQLKNHLRLLPKKTYQGLELTGDVMELYNGDKLAIDIREDWFLGKGVKAVSLSTQTLLPHQKALVYLISEKAHG